METIQNRLGRILNKAKTNNTNLGKVLDIIITAKNKQEGIVNDLNEEKRILTEKIYNLGEINNTTNTASQILEEKNRINEELIDTLQNKNREKEQLMAGLETEKLELTQALNTLQQELVINNSNNNEGINKLREDIRGKDEEIKHLTNEINKNNNEINSLKGSIDQINLQHKTNIETLQNELNNVKDKLKLEEEKYAQVLGIVEEIELQLNETNEKLIATTKDPLNLDVELDAITGGKSLKMKKHHKKHLKRKTRKIRNKKHKSK
jgi:hypothetical protein